jgi:succinoglycan biosynthesis protein ExoO
MTAVESRSRSLHSQGDGPASDKRGPLISVIIPLYNKGRHISRALESVRAQTFSPVETIVIDDGSHDDGLAQVALFPEVHVIERGQPGAGGYAARNVGIAAAKGNWIAFLDADDAWHPEHLSECADLIAVADNDVVLIGSGYQEHYPSGKVIRDVYSRSYKKRFQEFDFDEFIALWVSLKECPVWTSSVLAKKHALRTVNGFPAGRCDRGGDKDTWLRLANVGSVGIGTRETAVYYKDSDNMVTGARYVNKQHCIVATVHKLMGQSTLRRRRLLRTLRNQETFKYCLRTAKTDRVHYSSWRGFSFVQDPFRFFVLTLLTTPIGPLLGKLAVFIRGNSGNDKAETLKEG